MQQKRGYFPPYSPYLNTVQGPCFKVKALIRGSPTNDSDRFIIQRELSKGSIPKLN